MKVLRHLVIPLCAGALSSCRQAAEPPNILFILVDDMQSQAIRAWGNNEVETPAIDRLMRQGVTFTHAYTNGALCGALSMPSRAMLMTGRGLFDIQSDGLKIPECHTTLPEQLRKSGYETFATGKWHSDPASFNRSFSRGENIFFGGMHRYELNGHCAPRLHHYDASGRYEQEAFTGEEFSSKMFADAAIEFLEESKESRRPFMAFVSFTSPHDPRNQLPDYGKRYKAEQLSLPANFLPEHPFDNGEMDVRDELLLPTPRTGEQIREELAWYYGMVNEVDVQIGRVLNKLEESGKKENTLIVFASDNGLAMGQNGLIGKQNLYNHSVGVPLVIVDPRTKSRTGIKSNALCYLHDLFPTLCELTGVETPATVTGRSLKSVLEGRTNVHRESLFLAYSNLQRGWVSDKYKYIIYQVNGKVTQQLFDLQQDPGELINLAETQPGKAKECKERLQQEMTDNGDFCNLNNPIWWKDGHKLTWDEMVKLYVFE